MSDGGKGSSRRPSSVSDQEYAQRWDAIFAKNRAEQALQAMVEENERLGLYEDYNKPTRNNQETQDAKQ